MKASTRAPKLYATRVTSSTKMAGLSTSQGFRIVFRQASNTHTHTACFSPIRYLWTRYRYPTVIMN